MSGPSRVFLDTHVLLAAINADDRHHEAATDLLRLLAENRCRVIVSDWVLAEFLSAAAKPPMRAAAILAIGDLHASRLTSIIPATRKTWDTAFDLYRLRKDKSWSLIDCTSIVLCRSHRVRKVATHDHHFVQAGLEILIP
ncbi:MAG: type II toxin-antitoxin system VapC family toxin [Phycisphaeraceae bacterium]|nr:MAG: type II toxin-antitoxin system VapC family toxin [Phycisphaeraceae bacterium]